MVHGVLRWCSWAVFLRKFHLRCSKLVPMYKNYQILNDAPNENSYYLLYYLMINFRQYENRSMFRRQNKYGSVVPALSEKAEV